MDSLAVTHNLRDSFRILAAGRARGDVGTLPGVDLASLGVAFQMFNAAYLNEHVDSAEAMGLRLETARRHFEDRGMAWSFWICEDWLERKIRRKLSQICLEYGMTLASEMPGMVAESVDPEEPEGLPDVMIREVASIQTLAHFRAVGATCFHVPITWFSEVFNENLAARKEFRCWVGYRDGVPVATAALVVSAGVAGIYNVATLPGYRTRGVGEVMTRYAIAEAERKAPGAPLVLQSTKQGLRIYERLGFRAVTRILVYNSET